jgi:hypothetical protein
MANIVYRKGIEKIAKGDIRLNYDTLKIMLVNNSYTVDASHEFVDEAGETDPKANEIEADNYTKGFGGAGRKTVTGLSFTFNTSTTSLDVSFANLTWSSLGGIVIGHDTVAGAILIKENTSDTDSDLIAYFDLTDTLTDGTDFIINFSSVNNLSFSTTEP